MYIKKGSVYSYVLITYVRADDDNTGLEYHHSADEYSLIYYLMDDLQQSIYQEF